MDELSIIIKALLNSDSMKTIKTQLEEIKTKYGDLTINVQMDDSILKTLQSFTSSMEKMVSLSETQAKVNSTVSDSFNKEAQAIDQVTAAQKRYNTEKTKTIIDKNTNQPLNTTVTSGNNLNNNKQTIKYLGDGSSNEVLGNMVNTTNQKKDAADAEKIQEAHLAAVRKNLLQEENEWNDFVSKQESNYEKYLTTTGKSLLLEEKEWNDFVVKQEQNFQKLNELQTKQAVAQLKLGSPVAAAPKFDLNFQEAQDYAKTIAGLDAELRSIGYSINAAGEKIQTLGIQTKEGGKYQKDWTATLNEATGQSHLFEKGLSDVAVRQLGFVEKFKVMAQSIPLWLVGMSAVMQTLHFFTDGIAYVNEFNATLTQISTAVNYNQQQVEALGKTYQSLAVTMGATSSEVASGALEFFRQGLNDDQVLERLKTTTEYAKISGLAFQQSADLLTAATNTTNLDINKIADVFTLLGKQNCPLAA